MLIKISHLKICVKKNIKNKKEVTKAQFQKHWLETFEQQRTDN